MALLKKCWGVGITLEDEPSSVGVLGAGGGNDLQGQVRLRGFVEHLGCQSASGVGSGPKERKMRACFGESAGACLRMHCVALGPWHGVRWEM